MAEIVETEKSEEVEGDSALHEANEWLDKIKTREKFFADGWWKQAENATTIYSAEGSREATEPYNILYSNTEVLKPSLYSATPKPDVRSRYKEVDLGPVPIAAERFLTTISDPQNPGDESLDDAMSETVLSGLVPGMGFVRLRHYPDKNLPICFESGHYKGLIWGPARKWAKVPWLAFRHELTPDEIYSQFDIEGEDKDNLQLAPSDEGENRKTPNLSVVYELWDKKEKKILFLCEDWKQVVLKEGENTLKLEGFYPTPGPLLLTRKPGKLTPIPLYEYYRQQAEELNRVTVRLNKVLSAIKVRGAYNALLGTELAQILADDDDKENKLIPAKEAGMLAQNGGFDRQIWMLPIEKLIQVATQLYQARQQIKAVIYELTGISDILRGSSVASETATAQDLKNKWGTVRLRDMQKAVANYVRDLYRLSIDCGASLIPPEKWNAIIQLGLPTEKEKAVAGQQMQYMQSMAQRMQAQGIPPPPQAQQQLQQVQGVLQKPSIESVLKQLASDANRTYTINVQSDSTVDLDTATDKQEVQEFMAAMGQLLPGLQSFQALGPSGLNAAKEILIAVLQRFKFGLSVVDSIKGMQIPPPQAQGPTPEQEKKDAELKQAEANLTQQQEQLKKLLTQLQDEQRNLETAKKEFEAEVKVVRAEMQAQQAISQAQDQAKQAGVQAKEAQDKATFVERRTELQSAATGAKVAQKSQQQAAQSTAPLMQGVTQAITALQQVVQTMIEQGNRPREVIKTPTGFKSVISFGEGK